MNPTFEHFDHTADMGLRIRAATHAELLKPAGEALYAAIGDLMAGESVDSIEFNLSGQDAAGLLRDYLTELLHLFECKHEMATAVDVLKFDDQALQATVALAGVDFDRSDLRREVKAITYHELSIDKIEGGYEATLIVDI